MRSSFLVNDQGSIAFNEGLGRTTGLDPGLPGGGEVLLAAPRHRQHLGARHLVRQVRRVVAHADRHLPQTGL